LTDRAGLESMARLVAEMAAALQAGLLVRYAYPAIRDTFYATRLDGDWGHAYGTMSDDLDTQVIVDRARVES